MKVKKIYFVLIPVLILIMGGLYVIWHIYSNTTDDEYYKYDEEITVSKPETAIAIAKAILNERDPRNVNSIIELSAEEIDGIWIVSQVLPPPVYHDDGSMTVMTGMIHSVHIRKSNGEILGIGWK
jgi:hypothetical protein